MFMTVLTHAAICDFTAALVFEHTTYVCCALHVIMGKIPRNVLKQRFIC